MRIWENAGTIEKRLREEGRWDLYVRTLAEYVAAGLKRAKAQSLLAYPFAPGKTSAPKPASFHLERLNRKATEQGAVVGATAPTPRMRIREKMFAGRSCDERTAVQWVFDKLEIDDVKPENAPSSGAWTLLQECRRNGDFRRTFLQSIWPKLLPSKSQLETTAKFEDTGDDALKLIRSLKQATLVTEGEA